MQELVDGVNDAVPLLTEDGHRMHSQARRCRIPLPLFTTECVLHALREQGVEVRYHVEYTITMLFNQCDGLMIALLLLSVACR